MSDTRRQPLAKVGHVERPLSMSATGSDMEPKLSEPVER
jgi:hypothetical protein